MYEGVRSGVCPVLAHPERNPSVQGDLGLVERLVDRGTLVQITASSLSGDNGTRARRAAFALLERELAHLAASDVHGTGIRRSGLSVVGETIDPALAAWLTSLVPAAIVHDRELPPRPQTGPLTGGRLSRMFARRAGARRGPT